jgi:fibronectin type 3 domain-containing protein
VEPKDVFAPAAPAGLTSLAGPDYISLTWDPNPDKDVAGYRVWRRVEGQDEFQELTTALIQETTFQDKSAVKGVRYEYAVTAEDAQGNRSERSASISEQIKEGRR